MLVSRADIHVNSVSGSTNGVTSDVVELELCFGENSGIDLIELGVGAELVG